MGKNEFIHRAIIAMMSNPYAFGSDNNPFRMCPSRIIQEAQDMADFVEQEGIPFDPFPVDDATTTPEQKQEASRWWSDEADKAPVRHICEHANLKRPYGYGAKLDRIFSSCNIITAGDLLRIGRRSFLRYRSVGRGCISRIDDALEALYNITEW